MLVNGDRHVRRGAEGKLPGEKEARRGGQKAEVGEGEPWNSQRKGPHCKRRQGKGALGGGTPDVER